MFNDLLELAADIDLAAEFVEAGATLVIKVAQEVEAIAHVAELSATEAEALAIKVHLCFHTNCVMFTMTNTQRNRITYRSMPFLVL